jgi:hypothetical protein
MSFLPPDEQFCTRLNAECRFGWEEVWGPPDRPVKYEARNPVWLVLTCMVSLPSVLFHMYGFVGMLLLPFHAVSMVLLVALKFLLLNPPGLRGLQRELRWEASLPIKLSDESRPLNSIKEHYRFAGHLPGVNTKTAIHWHFWWEHFNLYPWLPFPLMVAELAVSEEEQKIFLDLPRWMPHLCCGQVCVLPAPGSNTLVVSGKLYIWPFLEGMYGYLIRTVFDLHIHQLSRLAGRDLESVKKGTRSVSARE